MYIFVTDSAFIIYLFLFEINHYFEEFSVCMMDMPVQIECGVINPAADSSRFFFFPSLIEHPSLHIFIPYEPSVYPAYHICISECSMGRGSDKRWEESAAGIISPRSIWNTSSEPDGVDIFPSYPAPGSLSRRFLCISDW